MSDIEIIKKIKAGQLKLSDKDVVELARSFMAMNLLLIREEQKLEPESDKDKVEQMALEARIWVSDLRSELSAGVLLSAYPKVTWFLKRYGVTLNPDKDLVFKQLARAFLRAMIEVFRNMEQIARGNIETLESEDNDFVGINDVGVDTEPPAGEPEKGDGSLFKPDTKWKDVTFEIVSNDLIKVTVGTKSKRYTFAEMKFKDDRKGDRPNKQWSILIDGFGKTNGSISWSNENPLAQKEINSLKTTVKRIRKSLRDFSGLDEDPFELYRTVKAYTLKPKLIDKRLGDGVTEESTSEINSWTQDSTISMTNLTHEEMERIGTEILDSYNGNNY